MASAYAPWWRRQLHRFAPFLFKKCPVGNYHWRWDRICYCGVGEHHGDHKGGAVDLRTGAELYLRRQYESELEQAYKLHKLADAACSAMWGGEHAWLHMDFDEFVSKVREKLSPDREGPPERDLSEVTNEEVSQ